MLIVVTSSYLICSIADSGGAGGIKNTQLLIGARCCLLDEGQGANVGRLQCLARDGEVFNGTLGLGAVEGIYGYADLTHGVVFNAVFSVFCHTS